MAGSVRGMQAHGFQYAPLPRSTEKTRLIVLSAGVGEDQLDCNTVHMHLTEPGAYETISYCWGSPNAGISIKLDGHRFAISANAAAALHGMRLPTQNRYLWIDALCIDQQNEAERNHQVGIMGKIYASATCNLIHLGGEHEAAQKAKFAIQTVYESIRKEVQIRSWAKRQGKESVYRDLLKEYRSIQSLSQPNIALDDSHYEALTTFYCLPWFS